MSKILVRIIPGNVFAELKQKLGLEINAIMQNGNTYFGKIESVTAEHINITDTRNHAHRLALSDMYEIIYDRQNILSRFNSK